MHRPIRRRAGFTLLELVLSLAIAAAVLAAALSSMSTTTALSEAARTRLAASAHYQSCHAAISRELRNAAVDTLSEFDAALVSSTPKFQRVTGLASGVEPALGPVWQIRFQQDPVSVTGIPGMGPIPIGRIVMESPGEPTRVLAESVVKDSFEVRQEGPILIVRITTLSGSNPLRLRPITGESAVTLRN